MSQKWQMWDPELKCEIRIVYKILRVFGLAVIRINFDRIEFDRIDFD
jgi:hypothetical protein